MGFKVVTLCCKFGLLKIKKKAIYNITFTSFSRPLNRLSGVLTVSGSLGANKNLQSGVKNSLRAPRVNMNTKNVTWAQKIRVSFASIVWPVERKRFLSPAAQLLLSA